MRRLILMRHASAEAGSSGMADRDRPLSRRGLAEGRQMGTRLAERLAPPTGADTQAEPAPMRDGGACAVVSDSLRTRQTYDEMRIGLSGWPEPVLEPALYSAGPSEAAAVIATAPDAAETLLMIGHNPTFEILLSGLSGDGLRGMVPGSMALFELGGPWTDLGRAPISLMAFEEPGPVW